MGTGDGRSLRLLVLVDCFFEPPAALDSILVALLDFFDEVNLVLVGEDEFHLASDPRRRRKVGKETHSMVRLVC